MARVAKLKDDCSHVPHHFQGLYAALSRHNEERQLRDGKKENKPWFESLVPALTEITTCISQLQEPVDSSLIYLLQVEFLLCSNKRVLIYTGGTVISSVVTIH